MRALNLGLKFCLELAAIASMAVWGWQVGSPVVGAVMAIATPLAGVIVWGLFAAPKARRRLPTAPRVPLELAIFLLAVAAFADSGHPWLALAFLIAIAVNTTGLAAFRQWEA